MKNEFDKYKEALAKEEHEAFTIFITEFVKTKQGRLKLAQSMVQPLRTNLRYPSSITIE